MLKIHLTRTLDEARRVIRDYGLDQYNWVGGIGTAEGFANRLFAPGTEMTTQELADAFYAYLEDCAERGTEEVDQEWKQQANDRQSTIHRRVAIRQKAADFIRDVKFKAPGGAYWRLVAALATTDRRLPLLQDHDVEAWQELRTVLHGIAALEPLFHSWYALPYRPGRNPFVDDCLRRDVERFDITLETAEPWTGQDEDWFDEAAALLRLVKFSEIHNELAMLIELGTARVNDHGHRELAGPAVVDEQAVVLARLTSGDAFDARQQ